MRISPVVLMALIICSSFVTSSAYTSPPAPQVANDSVLIASGGGGYVSYSFPGNSGTVQSNKNTTLLVPLGTIISLTAVTDSQHIFQGWDDGYGGGGSLVIQNLTSASTTATVNASAAILATFAAPIPTTVKVIPSSSSATQYNSTSGVTITATVFNQFGSPMPGVQIAFEPSYPGSLTSYAAVTNSSGEAKTFLSSLGTIPSPTVINVTAQTSSGIEGQASVTFLPAPPQFYMVTFFASGLGHDTSEAVLTVDGANYNSSQLPLQFNWKTNSLHSFVWTRNINGTNGNEEYAWTSTSGCGMTAYSGTDTVTSSCVISATYSTSFLVTFIVSPSASGKISWSGTGITSGSTTTSTSHYFPEGAILSISATSSSKLTFQSWSGTASISVLIPSSSSTTATVNGRGNITSNFANATLQTVSISFAASGFGSGSTGTILTVDGVSYGTFQKQFSWVVGSQHSFSWTESVSVSSISYVWQSTTGCGQNSQSGALTVGLSCTMSAVYKGVNATGSLTITTSGLPSSQSVGVIVTGPSGFYKQITITGAQKQGLADLMPGIYSVIGGIASGLQVDQGSIQASVSAKQTASVTIQYIQVAVVIKQVQLAVAILGQSSNGLPEYTLTATVLGNNSEGISGEVVQFITNAGTLSSLLGVTNSGGQTTIEITSAQSGVATVRALAGGVYSPATPVTFKQQQSCQLQVSESGLPLSENPIYWAVSIDGSVSNESVQTQGEVFYYNVSCGTHYYTVASPWSSSSLTYVTSPNSPASSGEVGFSNQSVVDLAFNYVLATTTLIFQEVGLGAGVPWSVGVSGTPSTQTTATSLQFSVPIGDVQYTTNPSSELSGVATLGSCSTVQNNELHLTDTCVVTLYFTTVQHELSFQAPGLPPGMSFSVLLNDGKISSSSNQFLVNDGAYSFAVFVSGIPASLPTGASAPPFQVVSPVVNGTVSVVGSDVTVLVQFNLQSFVWSSNGTLQPQSCALTTSSQNCVLYESLSSNIPGALNQSSLTTSVQIYSSGVSTLQQYFQTGSQTIQQMIEALLYSEYFS